MVATSNLYQCSRIDGVDRCCTSAEMGLCDAGQDQGPGIASDDDRHRDWRFFMSLTGRLWCALIIHREQSP